MTQICVCVCVCVCVYERERETLRHVRYLSWYCSMVPCVASRLLTVHLQLFLQLSVKFLWWTVQDELISGELWWKQYKIKSLILCLTNTSVFIYDSKLPIDHDFEELLTVADSPTTRVTVIKFTTVPHSLKQTGMRSKLRGMAISNIILPEWPL